MFQPLLFREDLLVQWLDGEKNVKSASELLNVKLYQRLAVKLHRESKERLYTPGVQYYCQNLFRDARVKNLKCSVSPARPWKCTYFHEYIRIGVNVFKLVKKDGRNQHFLYELLP